jgi:hypothetical protein
MEKVSYKERVKSYKRRQQRLPCIVMTVLQKVQSDILETEEEYWNFFSKKNIAWDLEESRKQWVTSS